MLAAGPVVACNNDDDFGFGSSSGFGGASSGKVGGFTDAASPPEYCDKAKVGLSCSSSKIPGDRHGCEVGASANAFCNSQIRCPGLEWVEEEPERPVCAPVSACPAEYTQSAADLCARPDAISLLCEYEQGTCGCAPVGGVTEPEPPSDDDDAGADAGEDAGADADAGEDAGEDAGADSGADAAPDAGPRTYEWKCVTPAAGCPRTRPRAGLRCVRPITCDYGDGVFEDGVAMNCDTGTWYRK